MKNIEILYLSSLLFLILFHDGSGNLKRFPPYVEKCHQNDPNITICFKEAIEKIKKYLTNGIPEFGFPPMNPLTLAEVSLHVDNSFKATFKNIKIYHLNEVKIENFDLSLDKNVLTVKMLFPNLRITSNYHIRGKILFLELDGNGPADGNITNVEAEISLLGHRYTRRNKEYLTFSTMEIREHMSKAVFHFEGMFKDNLELTRQVNIIINENIDEILKEVRPAVHVAIKQTVLGLISRIFDRYSLKELFPE